MSTKIQSKRPKVGVLDSGVGGLSVFKAITKRLPYADFAYCSDNANFPYGTKSEDEVIRSARIVARQFIQASQLDALVIACNTISTVALPVLRDELKIPVVGVVPAIKPAAQMTRTRTIGLLATPGTVSRSYTRELIQKFANQCRVILRGSSVLVELSEQKLRGQSLNLDLVKAEIEPLFSESPNALESRLDTVILGCTHFPLLHPELESVAPWPVQWVDSSEAIAARTDFVLTQSGFDTSLSTAGDQSLSSHFVAYFSKVDGSLDKLKPGLIPYGITEIEKL